MSSEGSVRFSKLKGRENYDTWKISAKSYLVIKKAWRCITTELSDTATSAEKNEDLLAWSELNLLLDESVYSYIAHTTTAKAAWDALEKTFEDSGLCRKVELLQQLVQLRLCDCSTVEDYVNRMITTSLKVKKAGLKLDDEIVGALMLAGLPEEFKPLAMAIENSAKELTSDSVKTMLLQEPRLESNHSYESKEAFYAKARQQRVTKFRCHKCGEVGHFAKDCRKGNINRSAEPGGYNGNHVGRRDDDAL